MARTEHGNNLSIPILEPDSTRFIITRSGFDTGTRTFSVDEDSLEGRLPELDRADTDLVWTDRTGATLTGTYGTMYVSGISDIVQGKNGICKFTVNYLGLIKPQKRNFETVQTQTTPYKVTVDEGATSYPGGSESVPIVTLVRVVKTAPDKTDLGKNIPPPGWEGFNPIYGYGSVSLPDPVFSGWVLKEREQEKCGTVYQVKEQYVFEIVRA